MENTLCAFLCVCLQSIISAVPQHPPCLEEEDCYEEAEPFVPASQNTGQCGSRLLQQIAEYYNEHHKFKAAAIAVNF